MPIFPLTSTRQGPDHPASGVSPQRDKCLKSILVLSVPCRSLHSRAGPGACPQPWCCPAGGTGAGLERSTLWGRPVPAAAASNELTGPSSPLAERDGGRTRSAGPSLHGTRSGHAPNSTRVGSFPAAPGGHYSFPSAGFCCRFFIFVSFPPRRSPTSPRRRAGPAAGVGAVRAAAAAA